jgi:hypothetical protein
MKRGLYDQLLQWRNKRNRKPLIVKGARQVGKTWLLEHFGRQEFTGLHTINFEKDPDACSLFEGPLSPAVLLDRISLFLNETIDLQSDLLLFDEIQECPRAITSLKYFFEQVPELALCCAGSHIGLAFGESSFPVGKVDMLHLYPLSFREFISNVQPELETVLDSPPPIADAFHNRLWEQVKIYFFTGGMPEVVKAFIESGTLDSETVEEIRNIQQRLLDGYRADFAKHAGKINAAHINRVFESVPEQLSKAVDSSVDRYRFKDVIPGYSKFSQLEGPIDWLFQSGLVVPVSIIESPGVPLRSRKKSNMFKLFLFDIGLMGCMAGIPASSIITQQYGTYKGFLAENYTAQELLSSGWGNLYSWRGKTSEIEFLLQKDDHIVPVEVKSGKRVSRAKSLRFYCEKYKPLKAVIVSAAMEKYGEVHLHIPLYKVGELRKLLGE